MVLAPTDWYYKLINPIVGLECVGHLYIENYINFYLFSNSTLIFAPYLSFLKQIKTYENIADALSLILRIVVLLHNKDIPQFIRKILFS